MGAEVKFKATGNPGFLQISGHIPEEDITGDCHVGVAKLKNLDTGIGMRNRHATEKYLEVGKYPEAKLDLAKNLLTLHGKTRWVKVAYKSKRPTLDVSFDFKLSDFGIEIPSFMGVTVADTVNVRIEAECQ
jgi:polyisoprenoid-binding protein YceI